MIRATATILALCAALAGSAFAADTPAPAPVAGTVKPFLSPGSRVLKTFDFEEKALGNYDTIPMFFNKVAGRGYPLYTGGHFDTKIFRSAGTSFRLDLDGGSVAYRLSPGKLPLNPNADYYIVGFVRTSGLKYAKAEISAWFADENGELLQDTEAHTERYVDPTNKGDWKLVHLFMPGLNRKARSLVMQLGVMQPQQLNTQKLGKFDLFQQDIKGAAWFDDIVVYQLPRLSVTTRNVGNIFTPGQKPEFDLTVSDLDKGNLKTVLDVVDADNKSVHRNEWALVTDPEKPWTQHVELKQLPPGFYTANLDVTDSAGMTTRRNCRFLTVNALREANLRANEFGLNADNWPVEAWSDLPPVYAQCGVGLMKLPAWRRDMSDESLLRRDQPFDLLIAACQREEIESLASFSEVPSVLTQKLNESGDSILSLLDADSNIWRPYVSFILARYASRVNLWQIGRHTDPFYSGDPRYARLYGKTFGELAGLMNSPQLVIPWNALYDFNAREFPNATLDLHIPSVIRPTQIPAYISSFQKDARTPVLAIVEPLDEMTYARAERITDFAQRVVLARSAGPKAVMMDLPMIYTSNVVSHQSEPTELLLVYRTLARALGGSQFKRELSLAPGVRAFLFDHKGIGTLVLFNESATAPDVAVSLPLGNQPMQITLAGVRTPLPKVRDVATIKVTAMPTIIDNLDTHWAEMISAFSLSRSIAPSGAGIFETTAVIENPYGEPISGSMQFVPPKGWAVDPANLQFSIPAGEKMERPITLRFPYAEFAGQKTLGARLKLEGDTERPQDVMDVATYLTLSSEVVQMEVLAHNMPTGELVLQHMVTNVGSQPLNAQAYALVPGLPRQQRFILDLQPGQTTIKRFVFNDSKGLSGKSAVLGLRQNDGTTLMTKSVPLN